MLETICSTDHETSLGPSEQELREDCLARAGIYRLLAGVFVEEPSAEFLDAMRDKSLLQSLAEADISFNADFLASDRNGLLEVLACEYATLFAASGGFPPVESVRLTGRYKQEPHFQALRTYQDAGFALGKGRFEVFPDQLGVELMFVAELLERCAAALGCGDMRTYKCLEKEIKRFWTLHLGRWVRGYGRLIERAANHSFYREMARFLVGFAEEEVAAMRLKRVDDLDMGRAVVPKSEIQVEFNPDEPVCGGCTSERPEGVASTSADHVASVHPLLDLRF